MTMMDTTKWKKKRDKVAWKIKSVVCNTIHSCWLF